MERVKYKQKRKWADYNAEIAADGFFVIHPSNERLTGREIGTTLLQHPYQRVTSPPLHFLTILTFSTFKPCRSFLDKPHRSTTPSPCANLESDRKPPRTCPSAGQRKASPPPPGRPQLTAGLAKATSGNRRAENSKTLMAQRCAAPPARSSQNFYPRPL